VETKRGARAISLADCNFEKRIVLAVPHRMLLGDDEPAAPISSDDAPVARLRHRSYKTVRSDGQNHALPPFDQESRESPSTNVVTVAELASGSA
jgi:hypothetical protein